MRSELTRCTIAATALAGPLRDGEGDTLDWNDLRVVLAVGRTGSLTRAGTNLGINQSTATRRLAAAEAALGATLFVRTQSGLTPTDAGEAAIARAMEIEARVERLDDEIQRRVGEPSGAVRLRGNAWVIERLTSVAIADLLDAHPQLELRTSTLYASEEPSRSATVSLWFERAPREMEFAVKLGLVPYAVYGPAAAASPPTGWVAFLDEDQPQLAPTRLSQRLRKKDEPIRFTATDTGIVLSATAAGIGRGLLPMALADGDPRLRRIGHGPPELVRELSVHLHPDTVQTARVQAVVRWLRECVEPLFCPTDVADVADVPLAV